MSLFFLAPQLEQSLITSFFVEPKKLNVSVGQTYLLEGTIDPGEAWTESVEGNNVTVDVGLLQLQPFEQHPRTWSGLVFELHE